MGKHDKCTCHVPLVVWHPTKQNVQTKKDEKQMTNINYVIWGTFGVLSLLFAMKRYYHLEYLKLIDERIRYTNSLSDLISAKPDLKSVNDFKTLLEIEYKLMLPFFKVEQKKDSSLLEKKYADYTKLTLLGFYIVAIAFIIEIIVVNA